MKTKGFSLVELMVVVGLMGVVSLGVMRLSANQSQIEKQAETAFEINILSHSIAKNLLNKNACEFTLGLGDPIANGVSLSEIKNQISNTLYDTTQKYGNRLVQINSIKMEDVVISGAAPKQADLNLVIEFKKLSRAIKGNKIKTKKIPLQAELDVGNNLVSCLGASGSGSLDCTSVNASTGGKTISVQCPLGYTLTGGGLRDTDISKKKVHFRPNMSTNTYECHSGDGGGTLTCYAICCRIN